MKYQSLLMLILTVGTAHADFNEEDLKVKLQASYENILQQKECKQVSKKQKYKINEKRGKLNIPFDHEFAFHDDSFAFNYHEFIGVHNLNTFDFENGKFITIDNDQKETEIACLENQSKAKTCIENISNIYDALNTLRNQVQISSGKKENKTLGILDCAIQVTLKFKFFLKDQMNQIPEYAFVPN
jgi:hypothetical protein